MRVIVTYASAGAGHLKAAEAIYSYLKNHCKEVDLKLIDILDQTNRLFKYGYIFGYYFLIKRLPLLWRFSFWITEIKPLRKAVSLIASLINKLNTKNFCRRLIKENPDFIISTHFLPSEMVAYLKKSGSISSKILTIITDFGVHPFWIAPETDFYIVASDFTKQQLIDAGVRESRIKEFGIPIDEEFLKTYDRIKLSEGFKLEANKFTVLIMTGSFGIGPLEKIINLLYPNDLQILVVCARNQKLYSRLKKRNIPNTKVFAFVDNIHALMAVSDVIITKPGGLSISEVLSMELIPIFISAIPGQETTNLEVLKKYGIGMSLASANDIKSAVLDLKNNPQEVENLKKNIRKIKRPFSSREIADVICQDSAGISC